MAEQSSVSLSESFERHPIAPTSLIPLKLSLPGMHEGMFHPLPPPIPVKAASEPTVTFVHMRQYNRIMKRRRSQLNGGFHFHINMKQPKKDSLVKHAKARQRSSAGTFKSIDKDMQTRKPGRRPCSNKPKKPDISCGTCRYCKDRPKFGGSGRLKQKCILLKKNPKATIVRNNFLSEIQACRFNPQLPEQDDEASKVSMESVSSANSEEEEEEEEKEEKEIAASTREDTGADVLALSSLRENSDRANEEAGSSPLRSFLSLAPPPIASSQVDNALPDCVRLALPPLRSRLLPPAP